MPNYLQALTVVALFTCTSGLYLTQDNHSPCAFTPSSAIRILDCSNRGLTEVPGVDAAMAVGVFYLDSNAIASIGPNAFANLTGSLTLLSIKSSALMDRIDNSAFAGLTTLTSLTVEGKEGSQSSMNKVNIASLLSGLRSLTSLSMSKVNVNELPISFAGATSIAALSLVRTAIATIDPHAFSNASNLRALDLSHNGLNVASGNNMNWLGAASSLESGEFASCGITSDYLGQIPSLPRLKKLDLSSNVLDRLVTNSLDNVATTLEELLLSSNSISEGNTQGLAGLVALKKLTMVSDTQLGAIPPQVKQLEGLELLDLRGTKVAGVPAESFHSSSKLRTLKLDFTNVHTLHALAFAKLAYLEEFTLSASALNTAAILNAAGVQHPGNWSIILAQIPRLQILSLSGTGAGVDNSGGLTDSIWDSLRQLASLRRLTLDYNIIATLPDFYLSTFANLTYVSLIGNSIDRATSAAFYGMGGAQLQLQDNRLSAIDNCTLAMYANVKSISLIGNPFKCDCAMQWLWLRVKSDSQLSLPSMQCAQPAALAGRAWSTMGPADFCASGEVPPNNCSVLVPSTVPPTTATFRYPLNITISKDSQSGVSLESDVAKLAGQFAGYTVKYWPVRRPEAALNTSLLPMTTGVVTLQVGTNEMYRYCYALSNGSNWSVEHQANCRDFTLNGLASAAVIAIAVLAAIIGIALIFVAVCLLCKKLRHRAAMKAPPADEDPYTYTYPDEKQIGKQPSGGSHGNGGSQFQATLRPESKRFSKRSRTNLAGSRPSLATSTTTLATSTRMSSPGFAVQNGARPASGHSMMMTQQQQQQQNPMIASGAQSSRSMHSIADDQHQQQQHRHHQQQQQQLSRSQDHLSDARANRPRSQNPRGLPAPPPRQAHSQELVLDVSTAAGAGRYPHQQPPSLPPPRHHQQQQQQQLTRGGGGGAGYADGPYLPMSAATSAAGLGESNTDNDDLSPTYNAYLPEDELRVAMQPGPAAATTAQQLLATTPSVRVAGGVDNSAFQRNDASGYYEMGQF